MLHAASALFAVTAIALPAGATVDLTRTTQEMIAPGAPPAFVALSPRDSVALVLSDGTRILVVRRDGTRLILNRPSDEVLAQTFSVYEQGPNGERTYPDARFAAVTLANDGTPAATVEFRFSGAYSGTENASYFWTGTHWRNALPAGKLPVATSNFSSIAVDSPVRYACNGDYRNGFPLLDEAERDPHYEEYEALLVDGAQRAALGYGAATAMRGKYVVGYFAGLKSVMMNQNVPPEAPIALEWTDGKRATLGPGIAYAVNERGDAVGDDGNGTAPMLWHDGRAQRLSDAPGTAYGIAANGTIVGAAGGRGFIVRGGDARRTLVPLDSLIGKSGWHITAAYAVAPSGRILAGARRAAGPLRVVVLDPVR